MYTCGCSKGNDSAVFTILLYENSIEFNSYTYHYKSVKVPTYTCALWNL